MALERLEAIKNEALAKINEAKTSEDIANIKNAYLSKKSELMSMYSLIGQLSPEERKDAGKLINDVKVAITSVLEIKEQEIKSKELNEKLKKGWNYVSI